GLDKVATVVPNGSDAPATLLSQCSPEVIRLYDSADVIIVKGQGNYESLEGECGNSFFLLRVKCNVGATMLKSEVGCAVIKQNLPRTSGGL
ncbi:MAG: DUF89 family protein, partial [Dehalococcoidia bacterium]|nr:DUF89 family protein [Dehalococcoidia bacterium]